jgi:hypothetical protein
MHSIPKRAEDRLVAGVDTCQRSVAPDSNAADRRRQTPARSAQSRVQRGASNRGAGRSLDQRSSTTGIPIIVEIVRMGFAQNLCSRPTNRPRPAFPIMTHNSNCIDHPRVARRRASHGLPGVTFMRMWKLASLRLTAGLILFGLTQPAAPAAASTAAPVEIKPPPGVTGFTQGEKVECVALQNWNAVKHFQTLGEWKFNRNGDADHPARLGLALSGGGMRSGVFSIGVMRGLNKIGVLPQVDIISSVSGGGYAASWYFAQHLSRDVLDGSLFDPDPKEPYQTYIRKHGELMSHFGASNVFFRRSEYVVFDLGETALSWPVNLFCNGLLGWHANVSPVRANYQHGIDHVFHTVPDNTGSAIPTYFRLEEMGGKMNTRHLPFFIINTTARIEDSKHYENTMFKSRIFEFTPLDYGSDYYGYWPAPFPLDFNQAISVSGAAVDSEYYGGSSAGEIFASAVNADLGYYIDNPRQADHSHLLSHMAPFFVYPFIKSYQKRREGNRIYLTDGGHSEDLAAYSLVRRLCGTLIVVDAGYDGKYEFLDYRQLKAALRAEMGVDFRVDKIDAALAANVELHDWKDPVMPGTIKGFPYPEAKDGELSLNVIYIKLSIDKSIVEGSGGEAYYGISVVAYYNRHKTTGVKETSEFPQQSTADQSYDATQVTAYEDLGYTFVMKHQECFASFAAK